MYSRRVGMSNEEAAHSVHLTNPGIEFYIIIIYKYVNQGVIFKSTMKMTMDNGVDVAAREREGGRERPHPRARVDVRERERERERDTRTHAYAYAYAYALQRNCV